MTKRTANGKRARVLAPLTRARKSLKLLHELAKARRRRDRAEVERLRAELDALDRGENPRQMRLPWG